MSVTTVFYPTIQLRNKAYVSLDSLNCDIENLKNTINTCKEKLKMWAVSAPKINKSDSIDIINLQIEVLLELYEESFINLHKLNIFKDYLEETKQDISEYYPYRDLLPQHDKS